jgi:hypothetical protein
MEGIVMKRHPYEMALGTLGVLLSLAGFGGSTPGASAQVGLNHPDYGLLVSSEGAPEAFVATRLYTREEMLAAVPYDLPAPGTVPMGEPADLSQDTVGEPGLEPSGWPEGYRRMPAESSSADMVFDGEEPYTTGTGYPGPFTRYENFASYTAFPYRAIGKLFLRPYGSTGTATCTASAIGNYAIWTAGHCVSDGAGHYHSNWVFVPSYRDGNAPYGQWIGTKAITFSAWHTSGNSSRDSAGVILQPLNGQTISQRVGFLGFSYNQTPSAVHRHAFGYPGAMAGGSRQIICTAGYIESDPNQPAPNPVGMGCDMQNGASGGPWIKGFSGLAGSGNYLSGNVSYGYPNTKPLEFFSPYFDSNTKTLWDTLRATKP